MFSTILNIIFPKSARERTVDRLAHGEVVLNLLARTHTTTAGASITTLTEYDSHRARALIHSLKFHNSRVAANVLAKVLHDFLAEHLADMALYNSEGEVLIVPVPLSRARKRARGFNQVERILQKLIQLDKSFKNLVCTSALARTRNTTPQTKLQRRERLKNLHGAFTICEPHKIRGANIIIVDDIATTGATLAEIERVLARAGARKVTLLAIARA